MKEQTISHPIRKREAQKDYRFIPYADGHAIVCFTDAFGGYHEVEIDSRVYAVFDECERKESSYLERKRLYEEHLNLTEEQLSLRSTVSTNSVEDTIEAIELRELLWRMIDCLSAKEKQRLIKHYFLGKTVVEIASEEKCSRQAVSKSCSNALMKLRERLTRHEI